MAELFEDIGAAAAEDEDLAEQVEETAGTEEEPSSEKDESR